MTKSEWLKLGRKIERGEPLMTEEQTVFNDLVERQARADFKRQAETRASGEGGKHEWVN